MPALFQQYLQAANEAIDGVHAEDFRHEPRQEVINGRPQADPARPAYEFKAIILFDAVIDEPRPGEHFRAGQSVVLSAISASLEQEVRAGDRFVRLDTGEAFEATGYIQPDRTGRTEIRLLKLP